MGTDLFCKETKKILLKYWTSKTILKQCRWKPFLGSSLWNTVWGFDFPRCAPGTSEWLFWMSCGGQSWHRNHPVCCLGSLSFINSGGVTPRSINARGLHDLSQVRLRKEAFFWSPNFFSPPFPPSMISTAQSLQVEVMLSSKGIPFQ